MAFKEEEKYLMFYLNEEFYGISILKVNEIIGVMNITPIPKSPDFMRGIINLRGKIIPVLELRKKFAMEDKEYDEQTCIIIVEMVSDNQKSTIGLLVDKVAEVINVYAQDVEAPPEYGQEQNARFLTGIAKVKEKVVVLLDIDEVVNGHEMADFLKSAKEATAKAK